MASVCIFNPKKFYEMLASTENIDEKLRTFRNRCEGNDIAFMVPAVNVLQDILQSSNELPLTKYNALFAVHQMLLTCTYLSLILIEIYILPLLTPIALHEVTKRNDQQLERYFIQRGFRSSVGIRIVGKKFVQLAFQIVTEAAKIRPNKNILHREIQFPSKCQDAYGSLLYKGGQVEGKPPANLEELRQKYLKNLKKFEPSNFANFLAKTVKEEIVFNSGFSLLFKKLLQYDDYYISVPIINACITALSDLSHDFSHKKDYLNLFSFFIKEGNIYAIIAAHNATFIREIFEEIIKIPGDECLSYGKMIFPEIVASHREKEEFYCEFLKCLLIWSVCLPRNEIGEVSEVKHLYEYLRRDRDFEFPKILMLENIITEFAQNLQKREIQNDVMLKIIDEDDGSLSELENVKVFSEVTIIGQARQSGQELPKPENRSFKSKVHSQINESTNQSFEELLKEVEQHFQNLMREKSKANQTLNHLREFKEQWNELKQQYQSEISSKTKRKGEQYCERIGVIEELFQKFNKKQISWRVFKQKVDLIICPDKSSLSYIQKIKQLPFPKKSVYEDNPSKRQASKMMEVVELEYYSKINQKDKKIQPILLAIHQNEEVVPQSLRIEQNEKFIQKEQKLHNRQMSKKQNSVKRTGYERNKQLKQSKSLKGSKIDEKGADIKVPKQILEKTTKGDQKQTKPKTVHERENDTGEVVDLSKSIEPIQPVTHNDYGIRALLIKRRQYLQQSISIKQIESRILPSDILDSVKNGDKMTNSQQLYINKESIIMKKHSSLRSIHSNRNFRQTERTKITGQKSILKSKQKQNLNDEKKSSDSVKLNQVKEVYQICGQSEERSQKESKYTNIIDARPVVQSFNRMVNSLTSRSIRAYKQYLNRSCSKPKSITRHSTDQSKSLSRSIIRRQLERLKPKQKNEKKYHLSFSKSKNSDESSPILDSEVATYHAKHLFNQQACQSIGELVTNEFEAYFPVEKDSKMIKSCLHSKGILLDCEMLEVGYVHFQKGQHLDFTLFFTSKVDTKSINLCLEGDSNLSIKSDTSELTDLVKGKQEMVKIQTSLKALPYSLPRLKISIKGNHKTISQFSVVLPCAINKYPLFKSPADSEQNMLSSYQNLTKYRTFSFKIHKKIQKKSSLTKYLPFFRPETDSTCLLTEFTYNKDRCLIQLIQEQKNVWHIAGCSLGDNTKTLKFILSSFCFLLGE